MEQKPGHQVQTTPCPLVPHCLTEALVIPQAKEAATGSFQRWDRSRVTSQGLHQCTLRGPWNSCILSLRTYLQTLEPEPQKGGQEPLNNLS